MEDQASPKSAGSESANLASACNMAGSPPPSSSQFAINSKDDVKAIAQQLASQTALPIASPDVWGVLSPISDKAKTRPQGSHILLHNNEHVLGRTVKDRSCQFDSLNVSARHCTIFRKKFKADESCIPLQGTEPVSGDRWLVYIKDSSSNGTFVNWQKLKRDSPEARIKDGDIISLVNAPEHENAFAFLYQEVKQATQLFSMHQSNGSVAGSLKRKIIHDVENAGECISADSKRIKGLGMGGIDGPVSLDDVRRLQRSNEELRNQLEAHVLTIEKLRAESRAVTAQHDAERKDLRETLSVAFSGQVQDLRLELGKREKEIEDYSSLCAQQQSKLEDLNRTLAAANQSRKDADEVMRSQKLNIDELGQQLEDERSQRRNDRQKAETDLKAAVERIRSEAAEELKRQAEAATCQLKEQLEMISKLQEADKENRSALEALRLKLEDTRESLVEAERTSRSMELRLHEEEISLEVVRKKLVEKEEELKFSLKELQNEKAAKEEALAKLASLELQMESAIRDLSLEKQRLQGARERIVLRETQLRAFHSTAEEIAALQQKQQEQLKAMMRVLEDGDDINYASVQNDGNGSMMIVAMDADDIHAGGLDSNAVREKGGSNNTTDEGGEKEGVGDADSQTTAGDVDLNRHNMEDWGDGYTQVDDLTALVNGPRDVQEVATMLVEGTERSIPAGIEVMYTQLLEAESHTAGRSGSGNHVYETQPLGNGEDDTALLKAVKVCTDGYSQDLGNTMKGVDEAVGLGGETMQLEDEDDHGVQDQKTMTIHEMDHGGKPAQHEKPGQFLEPVMEEHSAQCSRVPDQVESTSRRNGPMNTIDLLTSEVAGSWALSTPASVHCDNGGWSQSEERFEGTEKDTAGDHADFDASEMGNGERIVARRQEPHQMADCIASQNSLSPRTTAQHHKERRELNEMIDIVAPDFSRLHGLNRVAETAPDSEDHTEQDEEHDSDGDSVESKPLNQSVSVSARY